MQSARRGVEILAKLFVFRAERLGQTVGEIAFPEPGEAGTERVDHAFLRGLHLVPGAFGVGEHAVLFRDVETEQQRARRAAIGIHYRAEAAVDERLPARPEIKLEPADDRL